MSQHFTNIDIMPAKWYDCSLQRLDIESALSVCTRLVETNEFSFVYLTANIEDMGRKKNLYNGKAPFFVLEVQRNSLNSSISFQLKVSKIKEEEKFTSSYFSESLKGFTQQDIYALICKIEDMEKCTMSNIALAICDIIEKKGGINNV